MSEQGWHTEPTQYAVKPPRKLLGSFATMEEAERFIAEIEAQRCPCGGIDLHLSNYSGEHWYRGLGEWR